MSKSALFKAIFFIGLFALGIRETMDPDLWWHLKTGEYTLSHTIPRTDLFSYTTFGQPWIAHEWLSEVIMFKIYKWFGFGGLMGFFAALLPLCFYWVYCRISKVFLPLSVFAGLLGATMVSFFWGARPQVFNVVLLSFFLWLLEAVQMRRIKFGWFGVLPIVMVLWANLHSGFVLGLFLLGCFWLAQGLEELSPRSEAWLSKKERYGFLILICFCAGAMGLNPHGYEIFSYPFLTLGNSAQQDFIAEWQSPNFHLGLFQFFLLIVLLGIGSLAINSKKVSWFEFILYLGSLAASLVSVRHIPFFIIVSIPIICKSAQNKFFEVTPLFIVEPQSGFIKTFNLVFFTVLVVASIFYVEFKVRENSQKVNVHELAPAVDFLTEKGWQNLRGLNAYDWGGYLIWRGIKVFIDGRADLYQDSILKDYRAITDIAPRWDDFLKNYKIDYVLFRKEAPLSNILTKRDDWAIAYESPKVVLFKKLIKD